MTMRWRACSSYELPDALLRLLRRGPAADPIDDSFPDDAPSGNPGDYVGPQGPVLGIVLLRDLESLNEEVGDPEEGGEKRVVVARNTVDPRPPAAPTFLGAVVDSVPQGFRNPAPPRTPKEKQSKGQHLLTLTFLSRLAALGAGAPLAVKRSTRVPTPSVRLWPFPDHAGRSAPPASKTGSPSTGVTARQATKGGAEPPLRPGGEAGVPSTRRERLPHSERPSERVVE